MFCHNAGYECNRIQSASRPNSARGQHTPVEGKLRGFGAFESPGPTPSGERSPVWPPREFVVEDHAGAARDSSSVVLVAWMEKEVLARLHRLDEKLDALAISGTHRRGCSRGSRTESPTGSVTHVACREGRESAWRQRTQASARELAVDPQWHHATAEERRGSTRRSGSLPPLPSGDRGSVRTSVKVDEQEDQSTTATTMPKDKQADAMRGMPILPIGKAMDMGDREGQEEEDDDDIAVQNCELRFCQSCPSVRSCGSGKGLNENTRKLLESMEVRKRMSEISGDRGIALDYCAAEILQKRIGSRNTERVVGKKTTARQSSLASFHYPRSMRERMWRFLDDAEFSVGARVYYSAMSIFTIMSVGVALLQTIDPPILSKFAAAVVELSFEGVFAVELLARLAACPNHLTFFLDWHNVIDILAVTPLALRAALNWEMTGHGAEDGILEPETKLLLAIVPVLRLMKTIRRFERFRLLMKALELCAEALPICLFSLMMLTLVFGGLIYMVEPPENIGSLPQALWLTIVTMTTVGYGDVVPQSAAGNCIVAVLVITSVLYMAMPLGIIGQAFTYVWSERDKVLLVGRTQDRLRQWNFQGDDIPVLFEWFDLDNDGKLSEMEFLEMMHEMRLGLSKSRALELFRSIDIDKNGTVECEEFLKALFPSAYVKLYGAEQGEEKSHLSVSEFSSQARQPCAFY